MTACPRCGKEPDPVTGECPGTTTHKPSLRKFTVDRLIPFTYPNSKRILYRAFFPVPMFGEESITITDGTQTITGKIGYRITGDPGYIEVSVVPDE